MKAEHASQRVSLNEDGKEYGKTARDVAKRIASIGLDSARPGGQRVGPLSMYDLLVGIGDAGDWLESC